MRPTSSPPAVTASGLVLRHGNHVAIDHADLVLPVGRRTVIIGPNGSGKSTLLRSISGLHEVAGGSLEVLGASPQSQHARIAHVLQSTVVNSAIPITVREVVAMGTWSRRGLFGRSRHDDEAIEDGLQRLGIVDLSRRHLDELSIGQRQRVMVAQALVQQADLLLMDEPVAGLDITSAERIEHIIADEIADGRTVVLTTHDLETALQGDHVVLLSTRVIAAGSPAHVLTREHLAEAYGGHLHELPDGGWLLDDPAPH